MQETFSGSVNDSASTLTMNLSHAADPVLERPPNSEPKACHRMLTIDDLLRQNAIRKIDVSLDAGEQPVRLLYGTPGFIDWLESLLQGAEPDERLGEATPAEQVDALFHAYLSGKPLVYIRQFRMIRAESNAVWELKTPDTRIFGWFLQKDCFVAVFGDWADRVKVHNLYRGYRVSIRRIRRELGVEGTLCVTGSSPNDVISI
jgi:hypothetical protein